MIDTIRPLSTEGASGPSGDAQDPGNSGETGPMPSGPVTGIAIAPAGPITLGFAKTQQLTATLQGGNGSGVTWTIDGDATGASISSDGLFSASMYEKSYTVRATSVEAPAFSATAAIDVKLTQLVHVAGALGGDGFADDVGKDARTTHPYHVTTGPDGAFYFTDFFHAIRRVDAAGSVTTIAGAPYDNDYVDAPAGPGTDARFAYPAGILGYGDSLYVADNGNQRIRRLQLVSGVWRVTTLAGTGNVGVLDHPSNPLAASFGEPRFLTVDPGRNLLFVMQTGSGANTALRQINLSTPSVSTLCSSALIPQGSTGIAWDPNPSDPTHPRIVSTTYQQPNMTAPVVSIAELSGSNYACGPTGGTTYMSGSLEGGHGLGYSFTRNWMLIVDEIFSVLYGVNTNGAAPYTRFDVSSFFGYANETYDSGEAVEPGPPTTTAPACRYPRSITFSQDESMAVFCETANHKIRTVQLNTGSPNSSTAGTLAGRAEQEHVETFFRDGQPMAARFAGVRALTSDPSGNVFLLSSANGARYIRRVPADGGATTSITLPVTFVPQGIAYDHVTGNLIVTSGCFTGSCDHHRVYFIAPIFGGGATIVDQIGGTSMGAVDDPTGANNAAVQFAGPSGVAVAPDGTIYVSDERQELIRRIRRLSGAYAVDTFQGAQNVSTVVEDQDGNPATLNARFSSPKGLAISGNFLFVVDTANTRIRRIDLTTRDTITVAGGGIGRVDGPGNVAKFGFPEWIAVDGAGVLYVSNNDDDIYNSYEDGGFVRMVKGALTATAASGTTVSTLAGEMMLASRGVKTGALPARLNSVVALGLTAKGDLAVVSENSLLFIR